MHKTDLLIAGSGIAGLFLAIKTAKMRPDLKIAIMTKGKAAVTNTGRAQGGIAVVVDQVRDSFEKHVQDTLKAGVECDEDVVRMVVGQAPERLEELIALGVDFDQNPQKQWDLALEGGHTAARILHSGDRTGMEIEKSLLAAVRHLENVEILEDHFVIDLVTEKCDEGKRAIGAFFFDDAGKVQYIRARATVLSTGGCGQVFRHTTNSKIATGDGVAIAYRADAEIRDMQHIQFHPTALYEPGENPYFLLSEALRGQGAHIVNQRGKRFVFRDDPRGELATRDVVSASIFKEIHQSGHPVYLDCRHMDPEQFGRHFPGILSYLKSRGISPFEDLLPIIPVAHYQCGGVSVDTDGQTSVTNLYAVGECARTGLHGRNRLASNSLIEAVVFAHQAAVSICGNIDKVPMSNKVYLNKYPQASVKTASVKLLTIRRELQSATEEYFMGDEHVKTLARQKIKSLKIIISNLYKTDDISRQLVEVSNMLTVASIITQQFEKENFNNLILEK